MTSLSCLEANRANAQKSTEPKSTQGKARSAQNARKHGLRTKVTSDPRYRAEFLALRTKLVKEAGRASSQIGAPSLAMTELKRVIKIRHKRLDDALVALESRQGIDVAALLTEIETLERYERRAHYRLYRAWDAYAPAPGAPPSLKQHLPKLGRQTREARPLQIDLTPIIRIAIMTSSPLSGLAPDHPKSPKAKIVQKTASSPRKSSMHQLALPQRPTQNSTRTRSRVNPLNLIDHPDNSDLKSVVRHYAERETKALALKTLQLAMRGHTAALAIVYASLNEPKPKVNAPLVLDLGSILQLDEMADAQRAVIRAAADGQIKPIDAIH